MDIGEFEPQEIRESGEGSEDEEGQELNDATFEPLSYIEQTGGYQQAEAIQGDFTVLVEASSNIPIPAEVEAILMSEEPPPGEGEKGGNPHPSPEALIGKQSPMESPPQLPGSEGKQSPMESPPQPPGSEGLKSPKEDPNATGPTGTGADDIPPERAMGSGANDMPPERATGSGADDAPYEKAAGTGVDRPEPIDEPGAKEEQEMKYERDSDPSSRRKRD